MKCTENILMDRHSPFRDLPEVMARTSDIWEQLRGKSLFITGGTGFFGHWLLESFAHANKALDLDLKVLVLTRDIDAFHSKAPHLAVDPAIRFHQGDVATFAFPSGTYTHVIHAAATSADETFKGEDPLHKFDTLTRGTRRALEFAAGCGTERFLFASSGVAYGVAPSGMASIPESYSGAPDTLDVNSALGHGKRSAEFLCAYFAARHGWDLSIARCFSFIGPRLPLDLHYAIGNFIKQAHQDREIIVNGDGTPLRSYLYMADLVVWLLALLLKAPPGQIFNVGSDQAISIHDLAHLVRDILCPGKPVRILGERAYSVGNAVRSQYVPDISKARKVLGLDVWTPLEEAVRRTGMASI